MGMFDSVRVPCPKCGEIAMMQSKGGDCVLAEFDLHEAPLEVMGDINRHPAHCAKCGTRFKVAVQMLARAVELHHDSDQGYERLPEDRPELDRLLGGRWQDILDEMEGD